MKSATMRISSFLSQLWQYIVAILLIAAITALFVALRGVLETTLVALLYLIPLGLITAYWGLGPGLTSALITFLTFNYFFIHERVNANAILPLLIFASPEYVKQPL